jgi:hypothetical protein
MKPSRRALLLGLCAGALPGAARACRYYRPLQDRVSRAFDAIVVAHVTRVRPRGPQTPTSYGWEAEARVQRTVSGSPDSATYGFVGLGSSASCDIRRAPRGVGALWVLYLTRRQGRLMVDEAYSVEVARTIDARFGANTGLLGSS